MTSERYHRREETLAVLGGGAVIGAASGLVSLWVAPPAAAGLNSLVLFNNFAYWTIWAALALLVLRFARRLPLNDGGWRCAVAVHAVAGVAFMVAHLKLGTLAMLAWRRWHGLGPQSTLRDWVTDTQWLTRWQVEWEITMYWALVGLAHALKYRQESQERALAAARLDAELSAARLQVLQQQIHPHFLFNTLQSISALMHRNVQSAEEMIERLGELLRGSLRPDSSTLVTVREELEYVGHYLAIEKLNIGDRLTVQQDVAADVLRCRIPRLLLQPLVENAVRHGIAPAARGGTLTIVGRLHGKRLEFTVADTGLGFGTNTAGAGIALQNTRRRLELLYPGDHEFDISPGPDGRGVCARLSLPVTEEGRSAGGSADEPAA